MAKYATTTVYTPTDCVAPRLLSRDLDIAIADAVAPIEAAGRTVTGTSIAAINGHDGVVRALVATISHTA